MTKEELKQLCETWTEYLQCNSGSLHEGYMLNGDEVVYITDDAEVLESSEEELIEDINTSFDDFLRSRLWSWIQAEYIEEVLGIDYDSQQTLWLQVAEILNHMGSPRNEVFCSGKIRDRFWSPLDRAEYLRKAVKD